MSGKTPQGRYKLENKHLFELEHNTILESLLPEHGEAVLEWERESKRWCQSYGFTRDEVHNIDNIDLDYRFYWDDENQRYIYPVSYTNEELRKIGLIA